MGGSTRTPQWFLNLQAAGQGQVQIGAREHDVTAHLPTSAERSTLWPRIAALHRTSQSGRHERAARYRSSS
jgi:deazaflavin-dependent oxidoreductase (nitroreductase family)